MNLQALLAEHNLKTALIIDDGYDVVPRAADLAHEDAAWANFFADLASDRAILAEAFPAFEQTDASDLRASDEFVDCLWGLKKRIRPDLWEGIFDRYVHDIASERDYLNRLEAALRALGLEPITSGRNVPDTGIDAPLVFADLFLGSPQDEAAIDASIDRLSALLKGREATPPLVVLMSRSPRLDDKKADFRDRARLMGAMFRVHTKTELVAGATLERTLERLVRHRDDALRLAAFLQAWDAGLQGAKERFLRTVRRLDLAEYGQIRDLLLDSEGQPLGSYLLDVFDRLLQHEIEASPQTIRAADALNAVDTAKYPPPYLPGSPDLQDLVQRSIYQHPERLRVRATGLAGPVSFGDVLVRRGAVEPGAAPPLAADDALVVLTPPCDLVRGGAKRVMLLAGHLDDLTPVRWTYKSSQVKTPIVQLPTGRRAQIRWDLKDVRSLLPAELAVMLGQGGSYSTIGRLREGHALALQQRLLTDLGRVGLVAHMPATFPVAVEVYFLGTTTELQRFALPVLDRDGAVYFVGRNKEGEAECRLVLGQSACDELRDALEALELNVVCPRARATLDRLKSSSAFPALLERGLEAPRPDRTAFLEIRIPTEDAAGSNVIEILGLICRNPPALKLQTKQEKYGALVVVLIDSDTSPAEGPVAEPQDVP